MKKSFKVNSYNQRLQATPSQFAGTQGPIGLADFGKIGFL